MNSRDLDLSRFYILMNALERRSGGKRLLADSNGRMPWPKRGVYFFYEVGEVRWNSEPRVVRVGTHALKSGSQTTLWNRLSQHRGSASSGGGNHRGSIFRLLCGSALLSRDDILSASWDNRRSSASREVRAFELPIEQRVSAVIGAMPFLWLPVEDEPGPQSERGIIEKGAIALLSNWDKMDIDSPSANWLGHRCDRDRVRASGLWNQNHVNEQYDSAFLDVLEHHVRRAETQT